ncbi:MAG: hypothetical protein KGI45_00975 [Patescibacteria group bacterium]|nr:hypothetical protein [Patescibacteria group bacterium]MDE1940530.1 hypothetical protein [Patescibacteria group bacterium]MDE1966630.1 hypothetical protein [Patescibacteria group bacterium]
MVIVINAGKSVGQLVEEFISNVSRAYDELIALTQAERDAAKQASAAVRQPQPRPLLYPRPERIPLAYSCGRSG